MSAAPHAAAAATAAAESTEAGVSAAAPSSNNGCVAAAPSNVDAAPVPATSAVDLSGADDDAPQQASPSIVVLPPSSRVLLSSDQLLLSAVSFVRELMDNALDAGATNIQLTLTNDAHGVIDGVEVRDNGRGIPAADKGMLGQAHCTSKLRSFEQLVVAGSDAGAGGLSSFGFRGEALYFMTQSCARVEVSSKVKTAPLGWKTHWIEGRKRSEMDTPLAMTGSGTHVKVTGLFWNRPVRLQMRRKETAIAAEQREVQELLRSYAFAQPHVRFLCNQPHLHKPAAALPPAGTSAPDWGAADGLNLFAASVPLVLGTSAGLSQLLPLHSSFAVSGCDEPARLEGFVARPDASNKELLRSRSDRVFVYVVHNRPVTLPWLAKVIVAEWRAQGAAMMGRKRMRAMGQDPCTQPLVLDQAASALLGARFPMILLKIRMPAAGAQLDLNRSPDKRDVLLGDEGGFNTALSAAAKQAVAEAFYAIQQQEPRADAAAATRTDTLPATTPVAAPVSPVRQPVAAPTAAARGPLVLSSAASAAASHSSSAAVCKTEESKEAMEEDDELQIISSQLAPIQPSQPLELKQSQAASPPRRPQQPGVDFSTFTQRLEQPQSFLAARAPLAGLVASDTAMSTDRELAARPSALPHSPPSKRARTSLPGSGASTSSPMRQTQLSVVDPENSVLSVAQRRVPMNRALVDQLMHEFPQVVDDGGADVQPQDRVVARMPDSHYFIVSAASSAEAAIGDSVPRLLLCSPRHAAETTLYFNLLASSPLASVPLDAPIPLADHLDSPSQHRKLIDSLSSVNCPPSSSNRLTLPRALELCGFGLSLMPAAADSAAGASVSLVSVPADPSIVMDAFQETLQALCDDPCVQAHGTVTIKIPQSHTAAIPVSGHSCQPNNAWRAPAIRKLLAEQAVRVVAQQQQPQQSTAAGVPVAVGRSHAVPYSDGQMSKLLARMQRQCDDGLATPATHWSQLCCPHDTPVAQLIPLDTRRAATAAPLRG